MQISVAVDPHASQSRHPMCDGRLDKWRKKTKWKKNYWEMAKKIKNDQHEWKKDQSLGIATKIEIQLLERWIERE